MAAAARRIRSWRRGLSISEVNTVNDRKSIQFNGGVPESSPSQTPGR